MGILYLVSTPIGNLKDISPRVLETLRNSSLILCEDTRRTGLLLKNLGINKPLLSYFEHNEINRIPEVIQKLKEGNDISMVSDAGTPTISDPGYKLVRNCISEKLNVQAIPGPSAILNALAASGLPTDRFLFLGFLSHKEVQKQKLISDLITRFSNFPTTFICFESPHRLQKTLQLLKEVYPKAQVVVARELTKVHEEFTRGTPDEVLIYFNSKPPKGEITLIFRFS